MKTQILPENSRAVVCLGGSNSPLIVATELADDPGLEELGRLIDHAYGASVDFAVGARAAARQAIECAVVCGGYLRQAKAQLPHGQFLSWLKQNTQIEPRTARNYMALHQWVGQHKDSILKSKPHSLRQFYILAGILPEDHAKKPPKDIPDDLAKLRKFVRRTALEAAGHRDYATAVALLKALQPLAVLLEEVTADVEAAKEKHVSDFD